LYNVTPLISFAAGGVLLMSGIPVIWWGLPRDTATLVHPASRLLRRLRVPLAAVFAYGFAEAALLTMYPIFLARMDYGPEQIGMSLTAFIIGGILGTLPAGYLGDRMDRARVMDFSILLGLAAFFCLLFTSNASLTLVLSLLAGLGIGPVFVLALALMGHLLPKNDLPAGSALFTMAFGIGSTLGPWISSLGMEFLGNQHVFTPTMVLFLLAMSAQFLRQPEEEKAC